MSRKYPLSVSLIARNESKNLQRCLPTLVGWVAEIVVVINDCTDDTEAVARQFGAQVIKQKWMGYGAQKNISLNACTQPWILCLDCDEVPTPELIQSIQTFIDNDGNGADGASFPRLSFFLGRWIRHGDWYPDYAIRLLRRGQGKWVGGQIHEHLEVATRTTRLSGDLLHYSYPDIEAQLYKTITYTNLFVEHKAQTRTYSGLSAIFRAMWRFFRGYVLRLGFLDGYPGFYVAAASAFATFYRYSRLYERGIVKKAQQ
ncbi:MAG: glycosyltransferase family 2 protein [Verrucomicrobiota bacterium]|nr:glycosyltransferase family 2 protein [Verrucomicrobiota bacterium]